MTPALCPTAPGNGTCLPVLHYGQAVFEGMKAYKSQDGRILLFRPEQNMARLNRSNARLSIPQFDEEFVLEALKQLVLLDRDWILKHQALPFTLDRL